MSLSRSAIVASLTTGYPLNFVGLRDGTMDLMQIPVAERTNHALNKVTIGLLLVVTIAATKIKDASLVLALNGATFGNLLSFVYPAIMFGKTCPSAKIPAAVLGVMGVVLGIIGTVLAFHK